MRSASSGVAVESGVQSSRLAVSVLMVVRMASEASEAWQRLHWQEKW
jgi:hypothetical protein